jgi:hypothetical protein
MQLPKGRSRKAEYTAISIYRRFFINFMVLEVKLNIKPDVAGARHHEVIYPLIIVAGSSD